MNDKIDHVLSAVISLVVVSAAVQAIQSILTSYLIDPAKELKATIVVTNTLNQDVTVQVVGGRESSLSQPINIGSPFTVAAGSSDARTLSPDTSGFLPYISVTLQCSIAPTSGSVAVYFIRTKGDESVIVKELQIRDTNVHSKSTDLGSIFVVGW